MAGSNVTLTPDATNDKVTIAATDTTYSDFTGATSSAAGVHGLVPAPAANNEEYLLTGGGSWKGIAKILHDELEAQGYNGSEEGFIYWDSSSISLEENGTLLPNVTSSDNGKVLMVVNGV